MNNVKFKAMVRPGDTVDARRRADGTAWPDAFFMNAKVTVGGKTAVTFDFACKMAPTSITKSRDSPRRHRVHGED